MIINKSRTTEDPQGNEPNTMGVNPWCGINMINNNAIKKLSIMLFIALLTFTFFPVSHSFAVYVPQPKPKPTEPPEPPPPEVSEEPEPPKGSPAPTSLPTPTPCIPRLCSPSNNSECCITVGCVILGWSPLSKCRKIVPGGSIQSTTQGEKPSSFFLRLADFFKSIF